MTKAEQFWRAVRELAELREQIPEERRAMSGVRDAVRRDVLTTTKKHMTKPITSFRGSHSFLSNFYATEVYFEGERYPSSEHAYQAAKTLDSSLRKYIASLPTPGDAKREGRKVLLRPNWEGIKVDVMQEILRDKFSDIELREKLLATGDAALVEANSWGDSFWGVHGGIGKNMLGKILMELRDEFIEAQFCLGNCEMD